MTKDDLKEYVNKGVAASKDALAKAGKAVSKFSDESIVRLEISQFKSQIKKDKSALGEIAYKAFVEDGKASVESSDESVARIVESIKNSMAEIEKRKGMLEK